MFETQFKDSNIMANFKILMIVVPSIILVRSEFFANSCRKCLYCHAFCKITQLSNRNYRLSNALRHLFKFR